MKLSILIFVIVFASSVLGKEFISLASTFYEDTTYIEEVKTESPFKEDDTEDSTLTNIDTTDLPEITTTVRPCIDTSGLREEFSSKLVNLKEELDQKAKSRMDSIEVSTKEISSIKENILRIEGIEKNALEKIEDKFFGSSPKSNYWLNKAWNTLEDHTIHYQKKLHLERDAFLKAMNCLVEKLEISDFDAYDICHKPIGEIISYIHFNNNKTSLTLSELKAKINEVNSKWADFELMVENYDSKLYSENAEKVKSEKAKISSLESKISGLNSETELLKKSYKENKAILEAKYEQKIDEELQYCAELEWKLNVTLGDLKWTPFNPHNNPVLDNAIFSSYDIDGAKLYVVRSRLVEDGIYLYGKIKNNTDNPPNIEIYMTNNRYEFRYWRDIDILTGNSFVWCNAKETKYYVRDEEFSICRATHDKSRDWPIVPGTLLSKNQCRIGFGYFYSQNIHHYSSDRFDVLKYGGKC